MNEIDLRKMGGDVAVFDPQKSKTVIAKADALIELASKVKDWPLLETAIDAKLDEQAEFCGWWNATITLKGKPEKSGAVRGLFLREQAEAEAGISHQQVSRWNKRLANRQTYRASLYDTAWRKAMAEQAEHRVEVNSGENEWYTPEQYIEMARQVLGSIDLDPASSHVANRAIQAATFYSQETDGLAQEWRGNVWMNPPYAQPLISQFCDKLVEEHQVGNVPAAVVLTNDSTDTGWFHRLAKASACLCLIRGRIRFVSVDGEKGTPTQGQTFFYFGEAIDSFAEVFGGIGLIAEVRR